MFRPDAATSSSMINHTTKHSSTSSDDYYCDDDMGQSNQQNKQQHAQLSSVDEAHTAAANNSDNKQPKSPFTSVCIDCVETDRKRKSDSLQLHDVSINKKASKICSNEVSIKPGAKSKTKYRYYRHRVKLCSHEGCTNNAQKGGLCTRHGAKRKKYTCSHTLRPVDDIETSYKNENWYLELSSKYDLSKHEVGKIVFENELHLGWDDLIVST